MANDARFKNLNRINLNLLKVLAMICEERNITTAGERLGLSQSAVSHALSQLRQLFNDELFVRSSAGMVPTPLATEIGGRLPAALLNLESAIAPRSFVPAETERAFHIACSDYTSFVFLPLIMTRFEKEAPHARLSVVPMGRRLIDHMDRGKLDLVIAGVQRVPDRMDYETLFEEQNVWLLRHGHPYADSNVDFASVAGLKTVSVDFGLGDEEGEGEIFATWRGLTQWTRTLPDTIDETGKPHFRTQLAVPNFFAAAALVAQSDFVTQLPERLAVALAPKFGLVIRRDWPANNGGELMQIWHRSFGHQPPLAWLRGLVQRAAREMVAGY